MSGIALRTRRHIDPISAVVLDRVVLGPYVRLNDELIGDRGELLGDVSCMVGFSAFLDPRRRAEASGGCLVVQG